MADRTVGHTQAFHQAMRPDTQTLQAGQAEENPYNIWTNLQRHPLYPEYRSQVNACVSVHDIAFAHYSALLMDPHASQFIEAVSLSVRLAPPLNMWNDIVKLRCNQNFSSVRNIIIAEIEKQTLNQSRNPLSARSSNASSRSLAHLSTHSWNSSGSSRLSSNTDSYVHFEADDDMAQHSAPPIPETPDTHFPSLPPIITTVRGQRRAPEGKCFVCPSKDCRGKHFFKRVGDWTNHIEKVHGKSPWHDPSRFLRIDPRARSAQHPIDSEAAERAAALVFSDAEIAIKDEGSLVGDYVKGGSQIHTTDINHAGHEHNTPSHTGPMMQPTEHYGNTGIEAIYTDILFPHQTEHHGLSWFDHDDTMQQ